VLVSLGGLQALRLVMKPHCGLFSTIECFGRFLFPFEICPTSLKTILANESQLVILKISLKMSLSEHQHGIGHQPKTVSIEVYRVIVEVPTSIEVLSHIIK